MPNPFDYQASITAGDMLDAIAGVDRTVPGNRTAAQAEFLTDLMTRKAALVGGDVDKIAPWVNGLSKQSASDRITELKAWLTIHDGGQSPRRPVVPAGRPSDATFGVADLPSADVVPEGRYAIDTTSPDAVNALAFYKVDRPTEGRWAGRVFVKLITGGDEQRLSWATSKTVLATIADAGAAQASMRYGREIGNCGVCGRQLTNDVSRELGIGPKCRADMAW